MAGVPTKEVSLVGQRLRTGAAVLQALCASLGVSCESSRAAAASFAEAVARLRSLSLHSNLLTRLSLPPQPQPLRFSALAELDLSSNRLSRADALGDALPGCAATLVSLNLAGNALASLSALAPPVLPRLRRCDVSFNGLGSLAGISAAAPSLAFLDAQGNSVSRLSDVCAAVRGMPRLEELRLAGPRHAWANPVCSRGDEYRRQVFAAAAPCFALLDGTDSAGHPGRSQWHAPLLDSKLAAYLSDGAGSGDEDASAEEEQEGEEESPPSMLAEMMQALRRRAGLLPESPKRKPEAPDVAETSAARPRKRSSETAFRREPQRIPEESRRDAELALSERDKLREELTKEQEKITGMMQYVYEWAMAMFRSSGPTLERAKTRIETQIRHLEVLREQVSVAADCVHSELAEVRERDALLERQRRELERYQSRYSRDTLAERARADRAIADSERRVRECAAEIRTLRAALAEREAEISRLAETTDRATEAEAATSSLVSDLEGIVRTLRAKHKETVGRLKDEAKQSEERERQLEEKLLAATTRVQSMEKELARMEQESKRGSLRILGEQNELRSSLEEAIRQCEEMRFLVEDRERALAEAETTIAHLRGEAQRAEQCAQEQGERAEALAHELDDSELATARLAELETELSKRRRAAETAERELASRERRFAESALRIRDAEQRANSLEAELAKRSEALARSEAENVALTAKLAKLTAAFSSI